MPRLPQPGSDSGVWGEILNNFLSESLAPDGTLKDGIVSQSTLTPGLQSTLASKVSSSSLASVATTGAYADLSGAPALASVATSASYNDLVDTPSIPKITASSTPPNSPAIGDMWVDLSS